MSDKLSSPYQLEALTLKREGRKVTMVTTFTTDYAAMHIIDEVRALVASARTPQSRIAITGVARATDITFGEETDE